MPRLYLRGSLEAKGMGINSDCIIGVGLWGN